MSIPDVMHKEAGWELDYEILKRLGWSIRPSGQFGFYEIYSPVGNRYNTEVYGSLRKAMRDVPSVSDSTESALTLMKGLRVTIEIDPAGISGYKGYACRVFISEKNQMTGIGVANSVPLAICRAWLDRELKNDE